MKKDEIKIGLFGAGYFGFLHARNLKNSPFTIIGCYDPDPAKTEQIERTFNIPAFTDPKLLVSQSDAVDIVTSTSHHMDIAIMAASLNKHIFIEKPIADTLDNARKFQALLANKNLVVQVGHIERFNPAYSAGKKHCQSPYFINSRRLSSYSVRANDVSVVHDLMIHDIDAILALSDSKVVNIEASGQAILTKFPDICEARLTFENGCIANLMASRIHFNQERTLEIYGKKKQVFIDFLHKKCSYYSLDREKQIDTTSHSEWNTNKGTFFIHEEIENFDQSNAIFEELNEFYYSIANDEPIRVGHKDAIRALTVADKIEELALL